jgi:capsid protein
MIAAIQNRVKTMFGYQATESSGRRKIASPHVRSEDVELNPSKRKQLQASTRDIVRNYSVAQWAIEKHLDFVSGFSLLPTSGSKRDDDLLKLMQEWSLPENCDISGRHSLSTMVRMAEGLAVLDGDVLVAKYKTGHIQLIESDRVKSTDADQIHGIKVDQFGRRVSYSVHRRNGSALEFERNVPAANMLQHGYFQYYDQYRGISPWKSGINSLVDAYENVDYALAKSKLHQLFALAIYRESGVDPDGTEDDEDADDDHPYKKIKLGDKPQILQLDPGDKAEVMESNTPSANFREFMQSTISVALKAIDIPYCFYDENYTNFFGSRAALMLYLESCRRKRNRLIELLTALTNWKISQWISQGRLRMAIDQPLPFRWVHAGVPWWNPQVEIAADVQCVDSALRCRQEIRLERFGDDWFDVVDRLAEEQEYLATKGVSTVSKNGNGSPVGVTTPAPAKDDPNEIDSRGDDDKNPAVTDEKKDNPNASN